MEHHRNEEISGALLDKMINLAFAHTKEMVETFTAQVFDPEAWVHMRVRKRGLEVPLATAVKAVKDLASHAEAEARRFGAAYDLIEVGLLPLDEEPDCQELADGTAVSITTTRDSLAYQVAKRHLPRRTLAITTGKHVQLFWTFFKPASPTDLRAVQANLEELFDVPESQSDQNIYVGLPGFYQPSNDAKEHIFGSFDIPVDFAMFAGVCESLVATRRLAT